MSDNREKDDLLAIIDKDAFTPVTREDFMRVDNLCKELLLRFYELLQAGGLSPEKATVLANGADSFLRDFLVDFKEYNLFHERPGIVRQFAGNWFIVNNLEPDIMQLKRHLDGVRAFYGFLCEQKLISTEYLKKIEEECEDLAYYESRIESFWQIERDGFNDWEKECTLKNIWSVTGRA